MLENPFLKILFLEDETRYWVNPIFDERQQCSVFHTLFPMLLQQAQTFIFSILEWGQTRSGTSCLILGHIYKNQSNIRKCISPDEWLAVTLSYVCRKIIFVLYRVFQEERSLFWEVTVSVILSKNVSTNMCPILKCFRDRSI